MGNSLNLKEVARLQIYKIAIDECVGGDYCLSFNHNVLIIKAMDLLVRCLRKGPCVFLAT